MGKGQRADLALAAECSFEKRKKLWLDSLEHLPLKKEQNKPVFILL